MEEHADEGVVMVAVGVEGVAAWAAGVALTLALVIIFLVSSILNTVFLVIFFRRPALRSISNRFIVSLTVCNLLASWLLLPLVVADTFLPVWESVSLCRAMDAVSELVASASVFATLLIAVDRFCAITDPLHYHMLVTRLKSVAMIAVGWLAATLIAVAAAFGDLSGRAWNVCGAATPKVMPKTEGPWTYRSCFVLANMVVSFVVPMVLLTWIYVRIYHAAHQNSERTRRNSLCGSSLDAVAPSRAPSRTPSTRSTSSQIVTNLRYRISNASLFLHKEESRAAKISVVVIVLFFACWLPYYAAALLHTTLFQVWMPGVVQSVVMVLALTNSVVSPYVYLYRSRRIQREVRRLLGLPLSSAKSSAGSSRRRPPSRLTLEMIPPSPTMPDANFNSALNPYLVMCSGQMGSRRSPLAALLNKLFRAKGFTWEPWRDSITSTTSSSTATTSSSGSSASSGATTDASTTESESMLPCLDLEKAES
ncbi:probable G-protein coupled receptor No18 isoform X1 [Procambarus clarkii]|uniref:probable G-protein coupled receptor No18 isoform X1 n=2 Tax=Procambarus clarkii TaxID=6728 RepID=UPI001E674CC1|nr:probable G-protein coupled receptor No18 [Procambarus clarkii]